MDNFMEVKLLAEGKHLRLLRVGAWEYSERTRAKAAVVIAALTDQGHLLLVEQFRPPVDALVIELPAGLVGDEEHLAGEQLLDAARRELEEETGYSAAEWEIVTDGPPSPGLSNEWIYLVTARKLHRTGCGGGVDAEQITLHEVPLEGVAEWLAARRKEGRVIDPKIFAGVHFLLRR